MTPAERLLWQRLRAKQLGAKQLGAKLKRQVPCGPYILDFAFVLETLVIEVDGDTHATAQGQRSDAARDMFLRARGFRTLRFSNRDVLSNVDGVLHLVDAALR